MKFWLYVLILLHGLSSFQGRVRKLDRFLAKNKHTQRKIFSFVNRHGIKVVFITMELVKTCLQFYNFRLTDQGGCCIYYNEPQLLADIEEHLGVTIQQVGLDIKVSVEFLMG